ncbi:hypothetical protein EUX98_g8353 [Antrodiella citrinella]|uniref:Rho-GAP domain-containing protein n=1 Tax=Antrodiella citrinella TaxID=2447956 RepID=A0A4S4MA85_9APHY|nr:hypothetical protein EUX98_g8353 [Antrodiella citrinella]
MECLLVKRDPSAPQFGPRLSLDKPKLLLHELSVSLKPADEEAKAASARKRLARRRETERSARQILIPPETLPNRYMARHSDRRPSFMPSDWRMGMPVPDCTTKVSYVSVNTTEIPNRYYRAHSDTPFPHPGLKCVMKTLQRTLAKDRKRFIDYLAAEDVLTGSWWDNNDQDGLAHHPRKKEYKFLVQQAERDYIKYTRDFHVFGGHIKVIDEKASTPVSAHGFQFRVPIVVAACVEELYRRGMKTPDLFKTKPDPVRVMALVDRFDKLTDIGPFPDLRRESITTVASVLSYWITSNPEPIMHRTFTDAFSAWCVEPALTREKESKRKIHTRKCQTLEGVDYEDTDTEAEAESAEDEACPNLPSFRSRRKLQRRKLRRQERDRRAAFAASHPDQVIINRPSVVQRRTQMYKELMQLETPQVHHARLLSMLIAPHCFAVFVYLFTFLASLSDYPENNSSVKYLAEKFAWRLFGGPNKEMARELMEWLLTRWERIAHGFKSEDALAWEKQRDAERKAKAASAPSASSSKDAQNEKGERRGSSGSDYSDNAPSYHSTDDRRASTSSDPTSSRTSTAKSTTSNRRASAPAALRSSFRDPDTPKPHRRVLIVEPGSTPRRPSDTSITSRPEDTPVTDALRRRQR